jgi:hypothetical protein
LRVGIDPNISRLKHNYNAEIITFSDFYSSEVVKQISENLGSEFNLITSIAMFYDLIDPNEFVGNIKKLLSAEGIWVLELSNVFSMLEANSVDTICHEHLEYYSAFSINVLLAKHSLKVVRFEENQANGGSMQLYISHLNSGFDESSVFLDKVKNENKTVELIQDLFNNTWFDKNYLFIPSNITMDEFIKAVVGALNNYKKQLDYIKNIESTITKIKTSLPNMKNQYWKTELKKELVQSKKMLSEYKQHAKELKKLL